MQSKPLISVIIPTYNRQHMLRELLLSLANQDGLHHSFEVIVVDDGSEDGTNTVAAQPYPFTLRYIHQSNQGDAAARNTGACATQAEFLVFLDDDILVAPDYLSHLMQAHNGSPKTIISGTEILWLEERNPPISRLESTSPNSRSQPATLQMSFADLCSNNMFLRRDDYFAVGQMHNLNFAGSSMWCDVDFAYRAYRQDFAFRRSTLAICWHRDYVQQSLENHKRRMHEVAYRAATLFQKYPDLAAHLPMFSDKLPIAWRSDSPLLIMRKTLRRLSSSKFILLILEKLAQPLQKRSARTSLETTLRRWILGGHIASGYRKGLQELETGRRD